jgi:excisionase family DNA binding protein
MTTQANATAERNGGPEPRPGVNAELLDVRDMAKLLGYCSTRHIYRLADAGRLPRPLKLGALCRWRKAEVLRWIADGCPPVRIPRGASR